MLSRRQVLRSLLGLTIAMLLPRIGPSSNGEIVLTLSAADAEAIRAWQHSRRVSANQVT